jgi:hypothetical protein
MGQRGHSANILYNISIFVAIIIGDGIAFRLREASSEQTKFVEAISTR